MTDFVHANSAKPSHGLLKGASIIVTARNDELCPSSALRNHLTIHNNLNVPATASLFAYTLTNVGWEHEGAPAALG
jgi:hypothetical protein